MGLLYDFLFQNNFADNSSVSDNSETFEEIEESPEESQEDSPEESQEVSPEESQEESPEESQEVSPEESQEEFQEESEEESPDESLEDISVYASSCSCNGNSVSDVLFIDNMSVCIFLLATILGVCLFNIFRSKL